MTFLIFFVSGFVILNLVFILKNRESTKEVANLAIGLFRVFLPPYTFASAV